VANENLIIDNLAKIVARFNANDNRANLNCNRNPSNADSDLGIVLLQDTALI